MRARAQPDQHGAPASDRSRHGTASCSAGSGTRARGSAAAPDSGPPTPNETSSATNSALSSGSAPSSRPPITQSAAAATRAGRELEQQLAAQAREALHLLGGGLRVHRAPASRRVPYGSDERPRHLIRPGYAGAADRDSARLRALETAMIDLHYWPTPNGKKVTILLEECGLPYRIVPCSIGHGRSVQGGVPAHQPEQPHARDRRPRARRRRRADRAVRVGRDHDLPRREGRAASIRRTCAGATK